MENTHAAEFAPPAIDLKPLEDGGYELRLPSGRLAELRRMNGWEQFAADSLVPSTQAVNGMLITRTYGLCLLRKLDGVEVKPLSNPLEFRNVAESLTGADTSMLLRAYNQLENPVTGVALKNESSVAGESK